MTKALTTVAVEARKNRQSVMRLFFCLWGFVCGYSWSLIFSAW
jgi:hypothetical protein